MKRADAHQPQQTHRAADRLNSAYTADPTRPRAAHISAICDNTPVAFKLEGRLARAVPPQLRGDIDRERRAILALGISWFIVLVGTLLGVVIFFVATPQTRWVGLINTVVTCLLAALGAFLVRRGALVLAGHWITALISLGVAYSMLTGGGVTAPFAVLIPLQPVLALVISGRRAGLLWALISVATAIAIFSAERAGVELINLTPPGSQAIFQLIALLAMTVALLWIADYSEALKQRAIRQVEEAARQRDRALAEEEQAKTAAQHAIAANAAKTTFLATMSHELRTPLNVIIGYSELIEEDLGDALGEHADTITRIRGAGQHLLGLISDVLDLSRIEADRLELHPQRLPVEGLLRELQATFEALAAQRGDVIVVELTGPLGEVMLDPIRVRQILVNLLGNAIKFTDRGRITLSAARVGAHGRDWLHLIVSDTGVGIPADQLGTILEPFTQADASSTRAHEGSGLGLTIVNKLAKMMGGELTITSQLGRGTRVEVRLPSASDA
jgi:signal transduction histidine kinase